MKIPPSQLVCYRSFDGKIISAFMWVPFNLKRDGSNPAIVLPHGGPTWQITDYFNRTVIALVTCGYICIAPNVRGSTGYGMDFQKSNVKDLGGGDLQDEVYGEQVVKTLRDAGKTVDARYYANEGRGFAKRENQIDAIRRTIDFFDRYLKGSK